MGIFNDRSGSGVKLHKLWGNTNHSSSFSGQTITINNLKKYKILLIKFKQQTTNSGCTYFTLPNIVNDSIATLGTMYAHYTTPDTTGDKLNRSITITSDTTIVFGDAELNGSTKNTYFIPVAIYGIK